MIKIKTTGTWKLYTDWLSPLVIECDFIETDKDGNIVFSLSDKAVAIVPQNRLRYAHREVRDI